MNLKSVLLVSALVAAGAVHADPIATWTFETSAPATAGPISPEIGTGSAIGSHSGTTTYSAPAGNGSVHSFSSTNWLVNDYYQFTTSTSGLTNIGISFDQTSSGTGPGNFGLYYSPDGSNYTLFTQYTVLPNTTNTTLGTVAWTSSGSPQSAYSFSYDLSGITSLNNKQAVSFRLVDLSTASAGGGTVGSSGTDRVDNVSIVGTRVQATPEPSAFAALGVGALALLRRRRKA